MSRDNKQEMLCYLDHRTTDMKLFDRNIFGVIAHRRFRPTKNLIPKTKFIYDPERDLYVCPNNQELVYKTTTREGYREYKSNAKKCENCQLLSQCTKSQNKVIVVTRHVWEEYKEEVRLNRLTKSGKMLYIFRKEKIERSFADLGRATWASLLPVTGIKEGKRTGSPHCSLSEHEKDCHTPSKTRLS
jgi:hypothetical protein